MVNPERSEGSTEGQRDRGIFAQPVCRRLGRFESDLGHQSGGKPPHSILLMIPLILFLAATTLRAEHFILRPDHVLRQEEIAELAARGVEVQRVLPDHRYVIRATDAHIPGNAEAFTIAKKISRAAYREAARAHAFATVRLLFHDDVAFEDAQRAVAVVGGTTARPLATDFELPHGLVARVPSTAIEQLAADDRVFAIYGPPLRPKNDNAVAAQLSHVTPLFSAPYNLSGNGVVLSLFELAPVDTRHPEFGGRVTSHLTGSVTSSSGHPTHVSGTMAASGIDARAKGMAPQATVHEFSALDDYAVMLNNKQTTLASLSVVADNNSWGYSLGWQGNQSGSGPSEVWNGGEDLFGGYESIDSSPYDAMTRKTSVIFVHSAGNDGSEGMNPVSPPWFQHAHVDNNGDVIKDETFCYSQNGSGTDCPTPTCTAGASHCETVRHPTYGPFGTMGLLSSVKNVIAVGAVDSFLQIASFSSRGPALDGRVKPEIVAKGVSQYSTVPDAGYARMQGTSMSSPVVTGMMALFVEQWRATFNGQSPDPETLKVLLIAGADDLGNPGPDYTFGFGLANAQASVDLIRADNNTGARIRSGDLAQGQQFETTMALPASQNVRVVLGWLDPEIFPAGDETAGKTLVNDLDVKLIDPSGNAVFPYVLDPTNPNANATRGVNSVDNLEEIEIANAVPGTYRVIVTGKTIAAGPTQHYVLVANAPLGSTAVVCTDPNEPNDTPETATQLASGIPLMGRFCSQGDVDDFKFTAAGPGTVSVTATDTPIKITVIATGAQSTIAAGTTGTLQVPSGVDVIKLEPAGTIGASASYTITATYPFSTPSRKRPSRH